MNKEVGAGAESTWIARATPEFINYSEETPQVYSYSGTSIKGIG